MKKGSKKLTLPQLFILLSVVSIISFATTWNLIKNKQEEQLPNGIFINQISVGGLNVVEALDIVKANFIKFDRDLKLTWAEGSFLMEAKRFKPEIDYPRLENELKKALPKGTFLERVRYKNGLKKESKEIILFLKFDEKEYYSLLEELDKQISIGAKNALFNVNIFDQISIIDSADGVRVDRNAFLDELPIAYSQGVPSFEVPIITEKPEFTSSYLANMGIEGLVASFFTEFDNRNSNRSKNLELASFALDGVLLKPGEEFSFNAWVGPRIYEAGYKNAPVLVGGEITEDVGGGVCQVSTTLYNTALLGGMEIIERLPHSVPVSYVAPGLDAAVAFDYMDFRFRNSQYNYILITSEVRGNRIYCKMFGSPLQIPVKIVTENLKSVPFEIKKGKTPKEGREGLKVDTFRIYGSRKELISSDLYKPVDQIVL